MENNKKDTISSHELAKRQMKRMLTPSEPNTTELKHWGIKGQKWGKRRFQNKDGSLTPAGRERYGDDGSDNKSGNVGKIKPKVSTNAADDVRSQAKSLDRREKAVRDAYKTLHDRALKEHGVKDFSELPEDKRHEVGQLAVSAKNSITNIRKERYKLEDKVVGTELEKYLTDSSKKHNSWNGTEEPKTQEKAKKPEGDVDGFLGPNAETIPGRKALGNVGNIKATENKDKGGFSEESMKAANENKKAREKLFEKSAKETADKGDFLNSKKTNDEIAERKKKQEEAEKERNAKKREQEAEKNKKEEEAEKKENAKEREKNKKEREQEEAEKERNAKKREQEAEKNKREEEAEKKENQHKKKNPEDMTYDELKAINDRETQLEVYKKRHPDEETVKLKDEAKKLDLAKDITTTSGNAIKNQGVDIARQVRKYKNAEEMGDIKSMSTAELRAQTDRLIAENNYINASMARTTATSHKVESALSIFGSALTVGGAALGIAAALKKYRAGD